MPPPPPGRPPGAAERREGRGRCPSHAPCGTLLIAVSRKPLTVPTSTFRLLLRVALVALLIGACAGELETPGEALRLLGTELPEAIVAEPYRAQFHAVGGLRPYEYSLSGGALPPGLELQGGELRGVPTTTGEFEFGIEVSDANLSKTFQEYSLSVITPPTPALDLQLPETEVRNPVRVRARVTDARSLVGLRTELTWNPALFSLEEGSLSASGADTALLHEAGPGRLRVDLVLLSTTLQGDGELFAFTLVPSETPARLEVDSVTEFASSAGTEFRFEFEEVGAAGGGALDEIEQEPEDAPEEEPAEAAEDPVEPGPDADPDTEPDADGEL